MSSSSATGAGAPRPGEVGWQPGLVALDIDGTVADLDGRISPAVHAAVSAVLAAGAHVVLATGRSLLATTPVLAALGLTSGFAVCSNGAVTAGLRGDGREPEILEAVTFEPAGTVNLLLDLAPDTLVAVEDLGRGHLVNQPFPDGELMGDQKVVPLVDLVAEPVTKVILRRPESTPEEFFELVERAGLQGVNYAIGYTAWLDILPRGVSKASALEHVRTELGVPADATLAVGDGRNDLEMLEWAAWSFAMGHAPPEVQDAADEVTWSVDEDGVVGALARFFPPAPVDL